MSNVSDTSTLSIDASHPCLVGHFPGQPIVPDQRRRKTNMLFTPTAAAMQRDPRFPQLMEAMGLADYWRRRGIMPDYQKRSA